MNTSATGQYADLVWRKSSRSNGEGATQCVEAASLTWRKSSRSNGNGGECVEAAASWRKSSRSNGEGATNCVEAAACAHHVALRDSKLAHLPDFPVLTMSSADWKALLATVA